MHLTITRRRTAALLGGAALAITAYVGVAAGAGRASASTPATAGVVLAGPGSFAAGYYSGSTTVITAGSSLTFANTDLATHDVTSVAVTPCANNPLLSCPLFGSADIGLGQNAGVTGVETLAPGSYAYYCRIHPFTMRATLMVVDPTGSPSPTPAPSATTTPAPTASAAASPTP